MSHCVWIKCTRKYSFDLYVIHFFVRRFGIDSMMKRNHQDKTLKKCQILNLRIWRIWIFRCIWLFRIGESLSFAFMHPLHPTNGIERYGLHGNGIDFSISTFIQIEIMKTEMNTCRACTKHNAITCASRCTEQLCKKEKNGMNEVKTKGVWKTRRSCLLFSLFSTTNQKKLYTRRWQGQK